MNKFLSLTMFVLCAALVMAQLIHVSVAEASDCATIQSEQHISHEASVKTDKQEQQSGKTSCCESCHVHLMTIPLSAVRAEAAVTEIIVSPRLLISELSPDTLAEPPQA